MELATYTLGHNNFSEWVKQHPTVKRLNLEGVAKHDVHIELKSLDYTRYKEIDISGVVSCEDGKTVEQSFIDEYIGILYHEEVKLAPILKILGNANGKLFTIHDDCVFTDDEKTLVHIPEAHDIQIGKDIVKVGNFCCASYEELTTVSLPQGLIEIGTNAFSATGICRLKMPDSVTTLGIAAFEGADLETIHLSSSLQEIPDACFSLCFLSELTIPQSVRHIGWAAFRGAFIQDVFIPEGMQEIDEEAFDTLDSISLPATLIKIAPDFYYEECIDDPNYPPYCIVHPNNPIYYAKDGTLYFKATNKLVLDSVYNGKRDYD